MQLLSNLCIYMSCFHINKVNLNTSVNRLYRKDKKISPFFCFHLSPLLLEYLQKHKFTVFPIHNLLTKDVITYLNISINIHDTQTNRGNFINFYVYSLHRLVPNIVSRHLRQSNFILFGCLLCIFWENSTFEL